MIIEKLQEKSGFTSTEELLANYILSHSDRVTKMTVRELADAAFVSPPTVSRLCQKLGLDGFSRFKVAFSAECTEIYQKMRQVDDNYPFSSSDTPREIVDKLSKLSVYHILAAQENIDYDVLGKAARAICARKFVDVYGMGLSLYSAFGFAEKMTRIGYMTTVVQDYAQQVYRAAVSTKDQFAIVISHSGKMSKTLKVIQRLHESKIPTLLITGNRVSPMIQYATYVGYIYSAENLAMQEKLDSFGSQTALHFLLDCLFSVVFQRKYDEHIAISQRAVQGQFDL